MYGFSSFYMFRRLLRGGGLRFRRRKHYLVLIYKMIVFKQVFDYRSLKFIKGSVKS